MKALLLTIELCILMYSGCTQQHYSNADGVSRNLREHRDHDIAYQCEHAGRNSYDKDRLDYGPRIDVVKALWGRDD